MPHIPVLFHAVVEYLAPHPGAFLIDGTVNGGGHARELLRRIEPGGTLLCVDWDEMLLERATESLRSETATVHFACANYAHLREVLEEKSLPPADGILLDLGFSSAQLESEGRGFSFLKDGPLRMTYNSEMQPASNLLSRLREKEIAEVIREYGEERYARRIATAITESRKRRPIQTTGQLAEIIRSAVPHGYEKGRIDPATRTFQALRIAVNRELENLKEFLGSAPFILKPGARLVIISFHSLEDAIVKEWLNKNRTLFMSLTKKPVTATAEEIYINSRSRSAKLRAVEFSPRT